MSPPQREKNKVVGTSKSTSADIVISDNVCTSTSQADFLRNSKNKASLVAALSAKLQSANVK